jgi:anti-sigma regulatory factor (Ser/Thr protein kinase)/CheY-like chemotaxis protein
MATLLNIGIQPSVVRNALQIGSDPQIGVLLTSILTPESWNIQHAPSNASALKLVEAQHYDLIVTSEKTSGKDDIELLRKVRRLHSYTRLVILTDQSTTIDVITAMREHAFSYFSWPFSLDALQRMIRSATEAHCWDDGIVVVSATEQRIRLDVRCDFDTADRLLQFLQAIEELPDPEKKQLATAFRELLYNAIEYGGKLDPTNHVEIDYVRSHDMVTCRITDHGPGFTFDKIPHAAIANPAGDPTYHIGVRQEQGMRPGGYGILVARQLVDQLIYGQGGTEVFFVKHLDPGKSQSNPFSIARPQADYPDC